MNPRILLADDHPFLLKGLNDMLVENGYNIVGAVDNGQAAYSFIVKHLPEIAILDIGMPNLTGLEVAKLCASNHIDTKIILLTLHKEVELYLQAKALNVSGYVLKEFAIDEMKKCLIEVVKGNTFFSEKIKESLLISNNNNDILAKITKTEKRILKLIASGKTNNQIAELLFVSYRTVEKHRSNMVVKLNLPNKTNSLLVWVQNHKYLLK